MFVLAPVGCVWLMGGRALYVSLCRVFRFDWLVWFLIGVVLGIRTGFDLHVRLYLLVGCLCMDTIDDSLCFSFV